MSELEAYRAGYRIVFTMLTRPQQEAFLRYWRAEFVEIPTPDPAPRRRRKGVGRR